MEVNIEERDAKAVYFSLDACDDAKLFAEAAKFLERLKQRDGERWHLLGMNYQSNEFHSHLTLFLERTPLAAKRPPSLPTAGKDIEIRYL